MIYLFKDNYLGKDTQRIEADSLSEACIKGLIEMINNNDISVDTICSSLDIEIRSLSNE